MYRTWEDLLSVNIKIKSPCVNPWESGLLVYRDSPTLSSLNLHRQIKMAKNSANQESQMGQGREEGEPSSSSAPRLHIEDLLTETRSECPREEKQLQLAQVTCY